MRAALVDSRTALTNTVRGWARTQLLKVAPTTSAHFPKRIRDAALALSDGLPECIERLLKALDSLNEQITKADQELLALAENDSVCKRLMSVPGVGPVTSMRFVAAIDDATRFATAHTVESYLGLTPGENSSSERKQRTGITKLGLPQFAAPW